MVRIGVLLSGCGVFDGTEIHEAVFTLYELAVRGVETVCIAPNAPQLHVINHLDGSVMEETRNVLVESARIARGNIQSFDTIKAEDLDGLVLPGGFGTAKNHTTWAIAGPTSQIRDDVRSLITAMIDAGKPVVGICMAPTTIAKSLEHTPHHVHLTVGTPDEPSEYDIRGISEGMEQVGAVAHYCTVREITVDTTNRIITAPAYMMDATIVDVKKNIAQAIDALLLMVG